jgi:hypothetical protein
MIILHDEQRSSQSPRYINFTPDELCLRAEEQLYIADHIR